MNKYVAFILIFLLLLPVPVGAHSYVIDSNPAEGAVVEEALDEMVLTFNAGIESVSTATVYNDKREEVAIESIEVESPVLKIGLVAPLIPGSYTVKWKALGEDTHLTEGSFSFDVLAYELEDAIEEGSNVEEEPVDIEENSEQTDVYEERPVVEEDTVEPSLGRFILPILITGAIALVFLVKYMIKRIR
ncbi:copper resistance CopC family protein [Halalkalibacter alkalisediminis]|uniref:Copper resistance protein CopC n=1 Tax=Halalkalibacter alkalisediminis TaxID=935616 RepID=A0ABV6NI34_9BACI|nr:copper resistance protein CopC [Halalkalibacter alkalisediminis]